MSTAALSITHRLRAFGLEAPNIGDPNDDAWAILARSIDRLMAAVQAADKLALEVVRACSTQAGEWTPLEQAAVAYQLARAWPGALTLESSTSEGGIPRMNTALDTVAIVCAVVSLVSSYWCIASAVQIKHARTEAEAAAGELRALRAATQAGIYGPGARL